MSELRYPVGMQTFSKIVREGYVYVDKTRYIKPLLEQGQFIFLSRPRRFGKSLLLSTLEAYFEGRRDLFKGLAADSLNLDWISRPVLYFDFNSGLYDRPDGLEERLGEDLSKFETQYGIGTPDKKNVVTRFGRLIYEIYHKTGQEIAILVDEYDKPLLEVEENTEQFVMNQTLLKGFFSNLKSMDRYIQFTLITGVSRFSKVSIFSDLNNLDDISMDNEYADICGWSEEELLRYFRPGIEALAEKRKENFDETLKALRNYYDGYLFADEGSRLYNPFSVLKALKKKEIEPYWFESGTPTFLVRRIRKRGTFPPDINGKKCDRKALTSVGLHDRNPLPLMFQTGYLTIAGYDADTNLYELRFPNREVEIGFYHQLLEIYVPDTDNPFSPFDFTLFKTDLAEGRPGDFMERLSGMLKALPYEDHNESTYRAVTFLTSILSGTPTLAELHSYKGRSDMEAFTRRYIYIFEFKYNKTLAEAKDQLRSRDYAGKYAMDSRKVFLIAANFRENKDNRGLEYSLEEL